jgi:hypothetical protein
MPTPPHPHHSHGVSPWDFPGPSYEELEAILGDRQSAYSAFMALSRCPAEMRVIAQLIARLLQRGKAGEPPRVDAEVPPAAGADGTR